MTQSPAATTPSLSTSASSTNTGSSTSASTTSGASTSATSTDACTTFGTRPNNTLASPLLNFTQMFADYSEMAVHFNGTVDGNGVDAAYNYTVVSQDPQAFRVNVTSTYVGYAVHFVDYLWRNGTAAASYFDGQNYTGAEGLPIFLLSMAPYVVANAFGSEQGILGQLQSLGAIHPVYAGTVELGPTLANVTTYVPSFLPLAQKTCGISYDITALSAQVGTIPEEPLRLITAMSVAGSFSASGVSESLDVSVQVTSVTRSG